jgi:hypothetical protein
MRSRLVGVVGPTAKLDILDGGLAPRRIRPRVMELYERSLGAAVSVSSVERAPAGFHPADTKPNLMRALVAVPKVEIDAKTREYERARTRRCRRRLKTAPA